MWQLREIDSLPRAPGGHDRHLPDLRSTDRVSAGRTGIRTVVVAPCAFLDDRSGSDPDRGIDRFDGCFEERQEFEEFEANRRGTRGEVGGCIFSVSL